MRKQVAEELERRWLSVNEPAMVRTHTSMAWDVDVLASVKRERVLGGQQLGVVPQGCNDSFVRSQYSCPYRVRPQIAQQRESNGRAPCAAIARC